MPDAVRLITGASFVMKGQEMAKPSGKKSMQQGGTALVIFGITGDLAHRKLVPALYQLTAEERLPGPLYLIGFARRAWTGEMMLDEFRSGLEDALEGKAPDRAVMRRLFDSARYVRAQFSDDEGYTKLKSDLEEMGVANILYYLSTPPEAYEVIIENIGRHGLQEEGVGWTRIVVEKPYGYDLKSAEELDKVIHKVFSEKQIYRIDHYLGKDTVQNILVLRFGNAIFEPLWNNHYIDHVQITAAESIGVGSRVGYYDSAGVIRDIFQNHLLQLLCLVAMEVPVAFRPDAVRDEKVKLLEVLRPLQGRDVLRNTFRAQYSAGTVDGQPVEGYREEVGHDTNTETLLTARIYLDNWRWAGVPFYMRAGKRLPKRLTQISVHFKKAPIFLFDWCTVTGRAPNVLTLNLQPNEGIDLTFGAKIPGQGSEIAPVRMQFDYAETFGEAPPDAYQRLLLDAINGDPTLFTRSDEVHAAWEFVTRILDAWKRYGKGPLPYYPAGTWGPAEADAFIERDGRAWLNSLDARNEEC